MSTCQTAIVKTSKGDALYLNLFSANSDIIEKVEPDVIKKVFEKLVGGPLLISTDIGPLSLGTILEANTGSWGNNGEVDRVTCSVVIEPNALSLYLKDKGIRISGTVLVQPRGLRLLSYIDKVSSLDKDYDLSKYMENKHATRK